MIKLSERYRAHTEYIAYIPQDRYHSEKSQYRNRDVKAPPFKTPVVHNNTSLLFLPMSPNNILNNICKTAAGGRDTHVLMPSITLFPV